MVEQLREKRRGMNTLIGSLIDSAYGPPQTYLDLDHAISEKLNGNPKPFRRLELPGQAGINRVRRYSYTAELAIGCNDYPMIWDKDASEPKRRHQFEIAIREYPKHAFDPFRTREIAYAPADLVPRVPDLAEAERVLRARRRSGDAGADQGARARRSTASSTT